MAEQDDKLSCFVICPIGPAESDIRLRSDDIFNNLIEPIAEVNGYRAFRVIEDNRPGEITSEIVKALHESDLVIADLSGLNANVLYELALRHASAQPFIHLKDETTDIPFDIVTLNTITIRLGTVGGVDETRKDLQKQIEFVLNGSANFENPVSRFHQREKIEESGTDVEKQFTIFQDQILYLTRELKSTKKEMSLYIKQVGLHGIPNPRLFGLANSAPQANSQAPVSSFNAFKFNPSGTPLSPGELGPIAKSLLAKAVPITTDGSTIPGAPQESDEGESDK